MWNKLFKKRQSEPSRNQKTSDKSKESKQSLRCFSFRNSEKADDEKYSLFPDRFDESLLLSFQEDLKICQHPGEPRD
jgi:hypothetical protein